MNKKFLFILFAMLLVPMGVLGAGTIPTELGDFTVSVTPNYYFNVNGGNSGAPNFAVWDTYVAYIEGQSTQPIFGQAVLRIYNYATDTIVYSDVVYASSCCNGQASGTGLEYDKGYLFAGAQGAPFASGTLRIYDVSNIGFITETALGTVGSSMQNVDVVQNNGGGIFYVDSGAGSIVKYNSTSAVNLGASQGHKEAVDMENQVWSIANRLYDYENDFIAPILLHTMAGGEGNFDDWNMNPVNPEYISSTGHITLAGGSTYPNVVTASIGLTEIYPEIASPFLFFERDNIIARNTTSGNLVTIDATIIGSPVVVDTGIPSMGATYWREKDNTFFTYNASSQTATVYETEEPDLTFVPEEIDLPPTVTADFLGVDNQGSFIFQTEMSDVDGGRVYLSQNLYEASIEPSESFVLGEEINFGNLDVLNLIDGKAITTFDSITTHEQLNGTGLFDNVLQLIPLVNDELQINFNDPVTSSETETVSYQFIMASLDDSEIDPFDITFEFSAVSSTGAEIFRYRVNTDYFGTDDVDIEHYTGSYNSVYTGDTYDLGGQKDFYIVSAEINFSSQTSEVTIGGANGTIYTATVPFLESATSLAGTNMNILDGSALAQYSFHFASMSYEHETSISYSLDYTLFADTEPSIAVVQATNIEGSFAFGEYSLYSYGTDDDFGFAYLDSNDLETFSYTEETTLLTADEIENLISGAQTTTTTGFAEFIEGDILTDTVQTAVDDWGFKSTASKMFLAVVVILMGVAIGFKYGIVGSMIGAIGGLIIAFFMGWIPTWIVVTLVLTLIAIASMEARKLLVGGR